MASVRPSRYAASLVAGLLSISLALSCDDGSLPVDVGTPAPEQPADVTWFVESRARGLYDVQQVGGSTVVWDRNGVYHLNGTALDRVFDGTLNESTSMGRDGTFFSLSDHEVLRLDGDKWSAVGTFRFYGEFDGFGPVHAIDANTFFVVRIQYAMDIYQITELNRFNGTAWSSFYIGGINARNMWGTSGSSLFLAAAEGLYHCDGTNVVRMDGAGTSGFRLVSGSSATDVFAIRDDGAVVTFDGSTFTTLPMPPPGTLRSLRRIDGDLYAFGNRGACFRYSGGSWQSLGNGMADNLTGMTRTSEGGLVAVGDGGMLRFDGTRWLRTFGGAPITWRDIWVAESGDVYAGGDDGFLEVRRNGVWQPLHRLGFDVNAIQGRSASDFYAAGANGRIAHWDGISWTEVPTGVTAGLVSLWVGDGFVVAGGGNQVTLLLDGAWRRTGGTIASDFIITDVWASGPNDVYASGRIRFEYEGAVWHYDGATWSEVVSRRTGHLYTVWGTGASDVYAAGGGAPQDGPTRFWAGTIHHFDGTVWTRMTVTEDISGPNDVLGEPGGRVLGLTGDGLLAIENGKWIRKSPTGPDSDVGYERFSRAPDGDLYISGYRGIVRARLEH